MRVPRGSAVMYLFASLCFLIAGVVGFIGDTGTGVSSAFITLAVAFFILALLVRQSGRGPSPR